MTDQRDQQQSTEGAHKVLCALRLIDGLLHHDDMREPQRRWYAEVQEALAIQESFLCLLQKAHE